MVKMAAKITPGVFPVPLSTGQLQAQAGSSLFLGASENYSSKLLN